ncbi:hypothetical protein SBV1_2980011 [Verrucomicrobia bacterium]|nr:hypothetical protein SBV1_2980011 [Verrucomicrobiota bacterium]
MQWEYCERNEELYAIGAGRISSLVNFSGVHSGGCVRTC